MNRQVKVYTSRDCPECDELLAFLDEKKINYEERNITENREFLKELHRQNIFLTPCLIINQHYRILGFQKDKIVQLWGL